MSIFPNNFYVITYNNQTIVNVTIDVTIKVFIIKYIFDENYKKILVVSH